MNIFRMSGLCGLAAVSLACTSDGVFGPSLSHATATSSCGPNDGPAVAIYLATKPVNPLEPSPPYFRIAIWQPVDRLEGRSWTVGGEDADAAAWHHPNTSEFEVATGGTVRVDEVNGAQTIEGSVDVTFSGSGRVRREFRASWIPRTTLCG